MGNAKVCPHCGGHQFMAHIKRGCLVECDGIDENGKPTFKVIKEGAKNRYELEILRCTSCKHDLTENDLIGGAPCKNCGKLFAPPSLDENGNCEVCSMLLANPQLQNASQDDLLRLLARAMKGVRPDTSLVAQKQEQASKVDIEAPEDNASVDEPMSAADAILSGEAPSDVAQPRPRKRRTVKRVTEASVEESENVQKEQASISIPVLDITTEEQETAVNDITNTQEAPFPDLHSLPSIPIPSSEQPSQTPNVQVGSGFKMFDSGSDEEPF